MKLPNLRRGLAAAAVMTTLAALGACGSQSSDSATSSTGTGTTAVTAATFSTPADTHAKSDDGDYDASDATTIALADGATQVDGSGATVDGDVVTITAAGTYILTGSLSDGQVVVNSPGDGQVKLVLAGVDITSSSTSPVVVTEADEAVVILADGSTNTLSDAAASGEDDDEDDAPTATLFSMADLTIAGSGSLTVHGESNDAIGSKDGLVILSGTITVDAVDDGIRGKDYLVVEGGTIDVTTGGDGLKSDNDNTGEYGWFQLDAGTITVSAGSQAVDAIGAVNIADGTLDVTQSKEGLQARTITIAGGTVDIVASDDGINATAHTQTGGAEQAEDGVLVTISGGTTTLVAGADGLDSNGQATITGGTLAISARTGAGGDGPLDTNGTLDAPGVVTIDSSKVTVGDRISLVDSDGTVVASFVNPKQTASLVVVADRISSGDTYTVYAGSGSSTTSTDGLDKQSTVTATDASEVSTNMGGGPGGGGGRPSGGQGGPGGGFGGGSGSGSGSGSGGSGGQSSSDGTTS